MRHWAKGGTAVGTLALSLRPGAHTRHAHGCRDDTAPGTRHTRARPHCHRVASPGSGGHLPPPKRSQPRRAGAGPSALSPCRALVPCPQILPFPMEGVTGGCGTAADRLLPVVCCR